MSTPEAQQASPTPEKTSVSPHEQSPTGQHDGIPSTESEGSASRRKGGRQAADASEETKSRHAALYQHHKANPQLSQNNLAHWYSETFQTTMSQCSVSRVLRSQKEILKKQRELNGEEVEEFKPRKRRSLKGEEDEEGRFTKRARKSSGGDDHSQDHHAKRPGHSGFQIFTSPKLPDPLHHTSGFRAVNVPPPPGPDSRRAPITFSHYTSPTENAHRQMPGHPSEGSQRPFAGSINRVHDHGDPASSTTLPPMSRERTLPEFSPLNRLPPPNHNHNHSHHQPPPSPRSAGLPPASQLSKPSPLNGYSRTDPGSTYDGPTFPRRGSSRMEDMMETMQSDLERMKKYDGVIDSIVQTQREDRERLRQQEMQIDALRRENEMLRKGSTDAYLKELSDRVDILQKNLDREKMLRVKLVELFSKEEEVMKELTQRRARLFPFGIVEGVI